MTRKRYIKLTRAMAEKIQYKYNGKHLDGKVLKFYESRNITNIKPNSYAEAWEILKPVRDLVGM